MKRQQQNRKKSCSSNCLKHFVLKASKLRSFVWRNDIKKCNKRRKKSEQLQSSLENSLEFDGGCRLWARCCVWAE